VRKAGCADLKQAALIEKTVRSDPNLVSLAFTPFLVDRRARVACYFWRHSLPTLLAEKIKFSYLIPSALKVHPALYRIIDRMSRLDAPSPSSSSDGEHYHHLQVITFAGDVPGEEHSASLVSSLKHYDLDAYDTFFWTGQATGRLLLTAQVLTPGNAHYADPLSLEMDSQRYSTWKRLASILIQFTAESSSAHSLSVSDPCGFASLKTKVSRGRTSLNIGHLMDHQNPRVGAACLSFMIAHLTHSTDSPIFHLGITSQPKILNNHARSIVQGSGVGKGLDFQKYTSQSLVGDGQIVQVADTGVDANSCYFYDHSGAVSATDLNDGASASVVDTSRRKVVQYVYNGQNGDTSDGPAGHGTHVAGTIAGNSQTALTSNTGRYCGVAPGAQLAVVDLAVGEDESLAIPTSADLLFGPGYYAGARISSNSWGSFFTPGDQGSYSSSDIDGYLYSHMDSTVFFAAGNGGDTPYAVSMEAQGKNTVAVGSSETTLDSSSIDNLAWYSSFGPAYDGRTKPDIVCPGDSVNSANAAGDGSQSCSTTIKTGTSQATPACSGAAALVRQYFSDSTFFANYCSQGSASSSSTGCSGFSPSGVLVKAVMVHAGTQLVLYENTQSGSSQGLGAPPDYMQGFGRVSLSNVLPLPQLSQAPYSFFLFVDDQTSLSSYSQASYTLTVTDASLPVKATLVWYDPPNQDGITTPALLHDLDLVLVSPSGAQFLGNGGSTADTLNTVEQVLVDGPELGAWTVIVSSQALVTANSQTFSLVATLIGSALSGGGGGGGGGYRNNNGGGSGSSGGSRGTDDGSSSSGGSGGSGGFNPTPSQQRSGATDDYQQPGQRMHIKPSSSALATTPTCSCPRCDTNSGTLLSVPLVAATSSPSLLPSPAPTPLPTSLPTSSLAPSSKPTWPTPSPSTPLTSTPSVWPTAGPTPPPTTSPSTPTPTDTPSAPPTLPPSLPPVTPSPSASVPSEVSDKKKAEKKAEKIRDQKEKIKDKKKQRRVTDKPTSRRLRKRV